MQVVGAIGGAALRQQSARFAARLVGKYHPVWTDAAREWNAVNAEVRADIDDGHSRTQPAQQKGGLLLEPILLLEQNRGRDRVERSRNDQRNARVESEGEVAHGTPFSRECPRDRKSVV